MNWYNLKNNKCPQCGKDFVKGLLVDSRAAALVHKCGFKISEQRYAEIVSDMISENINNNLLE